MDMGGDGFLREVSDITYLSVLVTGGSQGYLHDFEAITRGVRRVEGMVKWAGSRVASREWPMRMGWKALVVPRLLYGAAVLTWSQEQIGRLESSQDAFGRRLWRVSQNAPGAWVRGEAGWSSMEEREAKAKIKFLVRLAYLPEGDLRAKVVGGVFWSENRWARRVVHLCRKYQLGDWAALLKWGLARGNPG